MPQVQRIDPIVLPSEKESVAAYCRVSTDSADQLNSYHSQIAYYTKLINENPDWELYDIYADAGITGTSIDKRDEFKRMIADCREGKIKRVLVKSVSRFGRNTTELLETTRELKGLGVVVVFEEQGFDTSQVLGEMQLNHQLVEIAKAQLGNVGGEPYWSWYGFGGRVEWCACFVSWCANQCGYIDKGIIPKFAVCGDGVDWFKAKSQWLDGSGTPAPGNIIFFDWPDENGVQNGDSDHVGIVEKVEGGRVYTIEGNSGDACERNSYPVGNYQILGYGTPNLL